MNRLLDWIYQAVFPSAKQVEENSGQAEERIDEFLVWAEVHQKITVQRQEAKKKEGEGQAVGFAEGC